MKTVALCIIMVIPTFIWAAPDSIEYSINVHVVSSYFVVVPGYGGSAGTAQRLSVLIDGKKYELSAEASTRGLLALGDYKARLVQDDHKTTYESRQEYELVFPDKTSKKFHVIGQSE